MDRRLILWLVAGVAVVLVALGLLFQTSGVKKGITNEELVRLQAAGATLADVRTNAEYIGGHIPDSLSVPLDQLADFATGWDKSKPVIVYCATGARSAEAATYLAEHGFKEVYDLTAGMAGWNGEVQGGQATKPAPAGAGVVETAGRPVLVQFSGST